MPLYASSVKSTGWWAMFITMTGDGTVFASLVFGYFFFWTIHQDFTGDLAGPGIAWPMTALALFVAAWAAALSGAVVYLAGGVALVARLFSVSGGRPASASHGSWISSGERL